VAGRGAGQKLSKIHQKIDKNSIFDLFVWPLAAMSGPKYPSQWALSTAMVAFNGCPDDPHKPSSVPIYQTATFIQPSAAESANYDYTRSGNPTRTALETLVAGLEGAHSAFAFTTGMAALNCMTRLMEAGDEILCNADIYGMYIPK
jgi:cystathionine beta-lyase/cystathionine gamma-synthase